MGIFNPGPVFAGQLGAGASNAMAQAQAHTHAHAYNTHPNRSPTAEIRPLERKVQHALDKVVRELPMRVAAKIHRVQFGPEGTTFDGLQFEVVFVGGKTLEFSNVDLFPTSADIAQICLLCP